MFMIPLLCLICTRQKIEYYVSSLAKVFKNIMRQAGNYYLPIAIVAKGNNAIFILKLKLEIT